jgi:hypothetical protein
MSLHRRRAAQRSATEHAAVSITLPRRENTAFGHYGLASFLAANDLLRSAPQGPLATRNGRKR